jgi:hypothetical protein
VRRFQGGQCEQWREVHQPSRENSDYNKRNHPAVRREKIGA